MDKRFIGALIAIVLILGGIFIFTSNNKTNSSNGDTNQPTNHVEGQGQDKVALVEYGDYECPFCDEYYPVVKQVQQEYNTQITFQFRNLPLTQIHPNAFAGARAAEAAALQGKFWQMHDTLYDNQDPTGKTGWSASADTDPLDQYFVGFAQQIGLNVTQFKADFASNKVNDLINADVAAFNKTGQQEATPTFFLDGKYVSVSKLVNSSDQPSLAAFENVINAEIKKKGFTPPAPSSSSTPATTTPATSGPGQSVQ